MPTVADMGYWEGNLRSLANTKGLTSYGLRIQVNSVAVPTSTNVQVMNANPNRRWALMQNINTDDITVFFGDLAGAGVAGIRLPTYGTLQIDDKIPWTGAMTAFQDSGSTINLFVMEAEIMS